MLATKCNKHVSSVALLSPAEPRPIAGIYRQICRVHQAAGEMCACLVQCSQSWDTDVDLSATNDHGYTALVLAIRSGNNDAARYLAQSPKVRATRAANSAIFWFACQVDVHSETEDGDTALTECCDKQRPCSLVTILITVRAPCRNA